MTLALSDPEPNLNPQAKKLLAEHEHRINIRCDRMFAGLFLLQWVAGIMIALWISPRTWIGASHFVHLNVWAAIFLGGAIISFPLLLIFIRPGAPITRHSIAVAQMLWSALLIHLSGGRVETHFHVFGSMAFLASYRDWRVLFTATLVVAADHMLRGLLWPQSVFGVAFVGNWRWMEHAGWVLFENVFLIRSCIHGRREMAEIARHQADEIEQGELRSADLTQALGDRNALLAAMDTGAIIATTDSTGRILSVNDNFCKISGYSRDELLGQDHRIVNSSFHPREFWTAMYKTVCAGGVWRGEVRNRTKNGDYFWVDTTIKGMMDSAGRLAKIVAVRADITDRKVAEIKLQQARRLESIGQLAAGIAHEINTPVQYISDNVRFIQTHFQNLILLVSKYDETLNPLAPGKKWEERAAEIQIALKALDFDFMQSEIPLALAQSLEGLSRVATIVGAMKDFSHPGSATKEVVDLNRAILSTLEVCRSRWKYVAELSTDLSANLPPIPCFVTDLNQVILNLVVNAADAIGEQVKADGGEKGQIHVSSQIQGENVEIKIRDNGPGIPEKIRSRMFEPFFTTKPVGKGTGQGLNLSRGIIVNKHGGELDFDSKPGGGTTFTIRLPLVDRARPSLGSPGSVLSYAA